MVSKRKNTTTSQLIRFGVVGIISTLLNYLIFWVLVEIGAVYWISMVGGYLSGVAIGYKLNKVWTFHSQSKTSHFLMYLSLYLCSLLVGLVSIIGMVEILNIQPKIANIIVIFITATINFLGSKLGVFRSKNG